MRVYLAEEIEGMNAEEAAVVAFLRLRIGQQAEKAATRRSDRDCIAMA
jgi:hypothetical protein